MDLTKNLFTKTDTFKTLKKMRNHLSKFGTQLEEIAAKHKRRTGNDIENISRNHQGSIYDGPGCELVWIRDGTWME